MTMIDLALRPLWTSEAIAQATGGTASANFTISDISYDSREVGNGSLFIALKGENTDGHKFLAQAFERGAAGALVSEPVDFPHILVDDTTRALDDIGKAARERTEAVIIGVTGSAGKTGTKEALFAALNRASHGRAHRSVKSYNNHVGVPLSLGRMPAQSKYGIFEMGMNHKGELSALTRLVRPNVAIITTIAPAHVGFFKDESEIADAKGEIFEALEPGGTAIIPFDNAHYDRLRAKAERHADRIVTFGFGEGADVRALDHVPAPDGGSLVTAKVHGRMLVYTVREPGMHWIGNSLALLAAVDAVGADLAVAGLALAELAQMPGRGKRHRIKVRGGELLLIDESYNANPASMAATINELSRQPASRHLVCLGSMKELGEKSDHYHVELADSLNDGKIAFAALVGDEMGALARHLAQEERWSGRFAHCSDAKEAIAVLSQRLGAGDALLVKGSNTVGLAEVVRALTEDDEG